MNSTSINHPVKRLSAHTLADLAKLHEAIYARTPAAQYFVKKYSTAYTGSKYIGFLAYNEAGMPIAFYGVIPCFLWHRGKVVLAAQSADTMTHPNYRNQGLFVQLAQLTYELCKAEGIQLIFGFPNENSLPGFVDKLGWKVSDTMDRFTIPVNSYDWENRLKRIPGVCLLYRKYVAYVLKKYRTNQQGLTNTALSDGFDGVYRNADHLKYKTYNQTYVIQANRSLVWIEVSNGLIIGDIALATDNFDAVMRKVTNLAQKLGVKQVLFHASPGTRLHKLFNDRYWSVPSFPVIFKGLGSKISTDKMKFTIADVDIF